MAYTVEEIKNDISTLSSKDFYLKHILRSDNWYFEKKLNVGKEGAVRLTDDLRAIISQSLGISFNNISIVGSSKTGCSLTPPKKGKSKLFRQFDEETSDIDIAIVSDRLFQMFWGLFRSSYSKVYSYDYGYISRAIYRGYISEEHLDLIDGCRKQWNERAVDSKRLLRNTLYIQPQITYRLYRGWEDFEEYHIQSIDDIKKGVL